MHKIFHENLKEAIGESKFVIAINIDVRGFSKFSKEVESAESALFIKKIFIKLIEKYFSEASFYKSTGDGLIIIYDVTEGTLKEKSQKIITLGLNVLREFNTLCKNEPMINFKTPDKCGIGISRGPATCLRNENFILDYSGDTLNMASRLMDCARPGGLVFDSKFGVNLINKEVTKLFGKTSIYLKGVAENTPTDIWYTKKSTKIPAELKRPIRDENWKSITDSKTLSEIKKLSGTYTYPLITKPLDSKKISMQIKHPTIRDGEILKGYKTTFDFHDFKYESERGEHMILANFTSLISQLKSSKITDDIKITISIAYLI